MYCMKLADYLRENGITRSAFAEEIGVSQSLVTQLCQDEVWPGREVARRISDATNGEVTPNDFLSPEAA